MPGVPRHALPTRCHRCWRCWQHAQYRRRPLARQTQWHPVAGFHHRRRRRRRRHVVRCLVREPEREPPARYARAHRCARGIHNYHQGVARGHHLVRRLPCQVTAAAGPPQRQQCRRATRRLPHALRSDWRATASVACACRSACRTPRCAATSSHSACTRQLMTSVAVRSRSAARSLRQPMCHARVSVAASPLPRGGGTTTACAGTRVAGTSPSHSVSRNQAWLPHRATHVTPAGGGRGISRAGVWVAPPQCSTWSPTPACTAPRVPPALTSSPTAATTACRRPAAAAAA